MASDPGGGSHHPQPHLSTPLHCSPYLGLLGKEGHVRNIAIYGPMIYTAPYLRNAFDPGKSITRASGRGWGPGNRDFFGPCEMASSR